MNMFQLRFGEALIQFGEAFDHEMKRATFEARLCRHKGWALLFDRSIPVFFTVLFVAVRAASWLESHFSLFFFEVSCTLVVILAVRAIMCKWLDSKVRHLTAVHMRRYKTLTSRRRKG